MTKDPGKSTWEDSYNNKSLSGIEFKDKNGKLVNFIVIKHDEILKNRTHRITIRLDENAKPILPPPRTFEEIIQAKRRQQAILYGSGSSSNATLSERTARRVAAAARQAVSAAAANLTRRSGTTTASSHRRPANPNRNSNKSRSKSKSKSRKKPRPTPQPSSPERVPSTSKATTTLKTEKSEPEQNYSVQPPSGPSNQVFTSLKDLNKYNPLFNSVDTKEVKILLKSAPPGASIILPNGTVIKKSRRGGARAGAGRKRSRPYPAGSALESSTPNGSQPQVSSNSSFSSQS